MAPHFFNLLTKKRKSERPLKKKKIQGNKNRFNDLPDPLLVHIISFLDLKHVVQTGVLAKRWKLLWTEIDTIDINCHFEPDIDIPRKLRRKQVKRYFYSVDKTLTNFSRIRNFSFTGFHNFECCYPDILDKWIGYALDLNVETMNLDYDGIRSNPPRSLFQSSSLTRLEISECSLCWDPPVNMPLLKCLSLSDIYLGKLEEILVGCPVLETLVLNMVVCFNDMHIISPSLKKIQLIDVCYHSNTDYSLEIRAPLLKELEILGRFMATKCVLAGLYSLVKARLVFTICRLIFMDDNGNYADRDYFRRTVLHRDFNRDWIRMVEEVLKSLCHVGDLVIGGDLLQVLTTLMSRKPSLTLMCKEVRVVSPLRKYDLPGIIYLLEAAPYLKDLIVEVYCPETISFIDLVEEDLSINHLHYMISYAKRNFFHLKNVVIEYRLNPCVDCSPHFFQIEGKCFDFELVDYILRSCVAFERLMLCCLEACSNETKCLKPDCAFQNVNQLSYKLFRHTLPWGVNARWVKLKGDIVFDCKFPKHTSIPLGN